MAFDIELIKNLYSRFPDSISSIREIINRPITLSEKILYTHLSSNQSRMEFKKGVDYVDFNPDRVAMQDATAQMALLQFMHAGKKKVAVPSTVHADHLIQAKIGADKDYKKR